MRKIKILFFVVIMVMGLMSLSLADTMDEINAAINNSAAKYNVDPNLVKAMIQQESTWNQSAISPSGAIGLMQLMPSTAQSLGVDPYSIAGNIEGGTKYIRQMLDMFNGNVELAVAAYNAGPDAVQKYGGIPPYTQTQNHVKAVMGYYAEYGNGTYTTSSGSGSTGAKTCTTCGGNLNTTGMCTACGVTYTSTNGSSKYTETIDSSIYTVFDVPYYEITEEYIKDFFDPNRKTNYCQECKTKTGHFVLLEEEYSVLGNKHYRACTQDPMHHAYIGDHEFEDGKCTVCGLEDNTKKIEETENTEATTNVEATEKTEATEETNFCHACWVENNKLVKLEENYSVLGKRHYRACTVNPNHHSYIGEHDTNGKDGTCNVCGYDGKLIVPENYKKTNYCQNCWYETDEFVNLEENYTVLGNQHYRACTANPMHHSYIGEHDTKGENGVCSVCGYNGTSTEKEAENDAKGEVVFSDLPSDHWAYNDVMAMVEAGIVSGRPNGTFGTNDNVTAEEFFVMMSGVLTKKGKTATIEGKTFLADKLSNDSNWSREKYIELAKILGQKSGDNVNELGAKEIKLILGNSEDVAVENYMKPITREKVANLIGAFVDSHIETSVNTSKAKDWDAVDSIYKKRMNKLIGLDFVAGVKDVDGGILLNPDNEITRAEVVVMVNKLYNSL